LTSDGRSMVGRRRRRRGLWLLFSLVLLILQQGSSIRPDDWFPQQVGVWIAGRYFDFIGWEVQAIGGKVAQMAAPGQWQLSDAQRCQLVLAYFDRLRQVHELEERIQAQYATLEGSSLSQAVSPLAQELATLRRQQANWQPLVEAILEEQVSTVLIEQGFAPMGLLLPPVRFQFSQMPLYLIVSPREAIRTQYGTMLRSDIPLADQIALEEAIDQALQVASLVDQVGGLGIYPTMVVESTWLPWVVDTIAHEWSHNYLTLRPLGWHYLDSASLRTINETVASIFGEEIGQQVLARYYPELAARHIRRRPNIGWQPPPEDPRAFDFGREMRRTRLRVDELLAEGRVDEAEAYMEARRQVFVENGYLSLRKLNQAYFAFHGSYATGPGAVDPIGPMLRRLRLRHDTLKAFIDAVQGITTLDDLERMLAPDVARGLAPDVARGLAPDVARGLVEGY